LSQRDFEIVGDLTGLIRTIPDFPKPGILFRDVTTLLAAPEATRQVCDAIADRFRDAGVDVVIGAEARGFIFGPLVAERLGAAFAPVRKPGKLPFDTISETYELEYGTDTIEMHTDAVRPGQNVLLVDDLLATGGTAAACCRLAEKLGGTVVGCAFVVELVELGGREKLPDREVFAVVEDNRGD
jgi:adenine phosphoribosyltransferase